MIRSTKENAMTHMKGLLKGALLLAGAMVLAPAVTAADFVPAEGAESVPLVEGKDSSGRLTFSAGSIRRSIVDGRERTVLAIPIQVNNRSRKDLLMKRLDLWVVTADGTVLSQPELRQDGLLVWRAEVNARKQSQMEALFRLDGAGGFDRFRLHWGGLVAYRPRSGIVPFAAATGSSGYRPAPMTAAADGNLSDTFDADAYEYELVHPGEPLPGGGYADPYWVNSAFSLSVGFGFVYGYPYYGYYYPWYGYPYYPYYPTYPCYNCGGDGRSARQVKEDAVIGGSGGESGEREGGGLERVDVAAARTRDGSTDLSGVSDGDTVSGRSATTSTTAAVRTATTTNRTEARAARTGGVSGRSTATSYRRPSSRSTYRRSTVTSSRSRSSRRSASARSSGASRRPTSSRVTGRSGGTRPSARSVGGRSSGGGRAVGGRSGGSRSGGGRRR
jgi:hypothetical protein